MTSCLFERRQQFAQPDCELKQPTRCAVNEYLDNPGVPRCEIMTSRGPPKPAFPDSTIVRQGVAAKWFGG
jgi:hypothetical protein